MEYSRIAGLASSGSRRCLDVVRWQPGAATFSVLTLGGALWQSIGHEALSPPIDVVDRYGVRLVDAAAGEWSRFLTAAFLSSAGWPHAILNVAGAALVARPLEREHETRVLIWVFFASAVAAFAGGVHGHGVHWLSAGGSGLILGCAGFVTARWATSSRQARVGAAVVLIATFAVPAMLATAGYEPRGSVPAHLGGFVAGVVVGLLWPQRRLLVAVAAVGPLAVGSTVPLLVPLLPGPPEMVGCRSDSASRFARGGETRLTFRSAPSDVAVRWISPTGEPGDKYFSTSLPPTVAAGCPGNAYEGAIYEVVDSDDRCVLRARAARQTSAVDIPR